MPPADINKSVNVVKSLKTKCSVGFDSLGTKLIQQTIIEEIVIPLEHIIDLTFVTGVVPENPKVAKIILLYRSGRTF